MKQMVAVVCVVTVSRVRRSSQHWRGLRRTKYEGVWQKVGSMKRRQSQSRRSMKQMVCNSTVVTVSRVGRSSKSEQWDDIASPDLYPLLISANLSKLLSRPSKMSSPPPISHLALRPFSPFPNSDDLHISGMTWKGQATRGDLILKSCFCANIFPCNVHTSNQSVCTCTVTSQAAAECPL